MKTTLWQARKHGAPPQTITDLGQALAADKRQIQQLKHKK